MGRKQRRFTLTLTDDKSGQAIRGRFIPYSQGGKFMKLWQDTGWEKRLGELQGNSLRVLWHLVHVAGWGNVVPGPGEVSREMSMRQPHVSRAYKELSQADFIRKVKGLYCLNPLFCWKGTDQQYEYVLKEFSPKARLANLASAAAKGLI